MFTGNRILQVHGKSLIPFRSVLYAKSIILCWKKPIMKLEIQYILLLLVLFLGCRSNLPPKSKALNSSASSNDDTAITKAIRLSDDFEKHKEAFIAASKQLIDEDRCSLEILEYNGGWVRSQKHSGGKIYFTYLTNQGATINDRIYLNVDTGKLFKGED